MRLPRLRHLLTLLTVLVLALPASAHIGNKDVFEQVTAGPYKLYVTVRTPEVIPGIATVEVRSLGQQPDAITTEPLLLTGEASKHPPTPDAMQRSASDPSFYTSKLWIMSGGSWQVRFQITGPGGPQTVAVAVPAAATSVLTMDPKLGIVLSALGTVLLLGFVGIIVAAVRESRLKPGIDAPKSSRTARIAGITSVVLAAVILFLGGVWWNAEAADYRKELYRGSDLRAALDGDSLTLRIGDADPKAEGGWQVVHHDRLLLDHGHLMHLYAIREPEMDAIFHLHPVPEGQSAFRIALPAMPPGRYRLFADIVYRSGFAETDTTELTLPDGLSAAPLGDEDAAAHVAGLNAGLLGDRFPLTDGYTMVWHRPASLVAHRAETFHFELLDASGKPATDVVPYLGMQGHAAFVRTDMTAFAHTHPDGSAAMPAMMLAEQSSMSSMMAANPTMQMEMAAPSGPLPATVNFPYGFPSAGRYRIIIQMKHGTTVETGVFDAQVAPAP